MVGSSSASWQNEVAVSGFGCVGPLGMETGATLKALRAGHPAFQAVSLFSTEGCQCHTAAFLPDPELDSTGLPGKTRNWHRAARMLLLATREAWLMAGISGSSFSPSHWIVGTTSGGMSWGEDFSESLHQNSPKLNRRRLVREYLPQQPLLHVADIMQWRTEPLVVSNACASGSNAVGHAARLVASGRADLVVCGGYDALSRLVFAGFDALRALSTTVSRPFDAGRDGLLLGEGAAVLVLESAAHLAKRKGQPLAWLRGYGATSDNHHLTQPDPSGIGPSSAMHRALTTAGWEPASVDYINAHGTGTPYNDSSEGRAIMQLCPQALVSSTKSLMGHSLGAAGAIEAVFSILSLQKEFLPPNAGFRSGDSDLSLRIVTKTTPFRARRILSNSFGFGGANACLALEAAE
jgi:3-oxoacyl-[acyl-carrier-protein] synthase II